MHEHDVTGSATSFEKGALPAEMAGGFRADASSCTRARRTDCSLPIANA